VRVFTALVAPPTLITALALFFGWTRISTQVSYFGIDPTLVGFSTQDYLLRSADTVFVPLGALLISAYIAAGAHSLITSVLADHPRVRLTVLVGLFSLGSALQWRGEHCVL
jgi:hypothetical protein